VVMADGAALGVEQPEMPSGRPFADEAAKLGSKPPCEKARQLVFSPCCTGHSVRPSSGPSAPHAGAPGHRRVTCTSSRSSRLSPLLLLRWLQTISSRSVDP
jgi:hypothetical protein